MTPEPTIACRVLLTELPAGGFDGFEGYRNVAPGIQRGEEIEPGEDVDHGTIGFTLTLRVRGHPETGGPDFLGDHVFGTPQERHLSICWCGDKDGERRPFRRMKVSLKTVEWKQVEGLAMSEEQVLEAEVSALAGDGGPASASVPLLGEGWRIAEA